MTFDLWTSHTRLDTFALAVAFNTNGTALAMNLKPLLIEYQLTNKVTAYVKDESNNLHTLEEALKNG